MEEGMFIEIPVGGKFSYDGTWYECKELALGITTISENECSRCDFRDKQNKECLGAGRLMLCDSLERSDNLNVVFNRINEE